MTLLLLFRHLDAPKHTHFPLDCQFFHFSRRMYTAYSLLRRLRISLFSGLFTPTEGRFFPTFRAGAFFNGGERKAVGWNSGYKSLNLWLTVMANGVVGIL